MFSFKKYTLLVQVAPILHATMEYYLMTENERAIVKAGCLINFNRARNR